MPVTFIFLPPLEIDMKWSIDGGFDEAESFSFCHESLQFAQTKMQVTDMNKLRLTSQQCEQWCWRSAPDDVYSRVQFLGMNMTLRRQFRHLMNQICDQLFERTLPFLNPKLVHCFKRGDRERHAIIKLRRDGLL